MLFDPDNYEISIRGVEPTYNHTLDRDARRETSHESHLTSISVTVHFRLARGSGEYDRTFLIDFDVDHEAHAVTFRSVGDKFESHTSFDPEKFWYVSHFAAAVVEEWLDSVGLQYQPPSQSVRMWDNPPEPTVHTKLKVTPEEDDA